MTKKLAEIFNWQELKLSKRNVKMAHNYRHSSSPWSNYRVSRAFLHRNVNAMKCIVTQEYSSNIFNLYSCPICRYNTNSNNIHYDDKEVTSEFMKRYVQYLKENNIIPARLAILSRKKRLDIIHHIMKQSSNRYIQPKELDILANYNQMDQAEMSYILNQARNYARLEYGSGKQISAKMQEIIADWLRKHDYRLPDAAEKQKLLESTGLTPVQLNYQLYYMIQKWKSMQKGIPTKDSEKILRDWIKETGITNPSRKERDQLIDLTGYSRKQLAYRISKIVNPPGNVTEGSKERIVSWLEVNNNREPTEEEKLQLMEETGWSATQLRSQMRHLRESSGNLSIENKMKISQWLRDHNFQSPSKEVREQLRKETGLSSRQLNSFLLYSRRVHFNAKTTSNATQPKE